MEREKISVFISSVQKELEPERLALFSLLTTDPALKDYLEPVLFEHLSPPIRSTKKPYLEELDKCQAYILMLDREYAPEKITKSPTHEEYDLACSMQIPILVMFKGRHDSLRDQRLQEFIKAIKNDGFTYKRFTDRIDLKQEAARWLIRVLKEEFQIELTTSQGEISEDAIEAASTFETTQQGVLSLSDLDIDAARELFKGFTKKISKSMSMKTMAPIFRMRGLIWHDSETVELRPTIAGIVFLGKNPWIAYAQCQVLADVYRDTKVTAKPLAQAKLSGPITHVIRELLEFVDRNTVHPTRVVGINNVELNEYPRRAVREALVNAFAHRNYEDTSRKIRLEIFRDRLVVSSPGYPPKPLTLAKLRRGNYESCRRNPVIAECLSSLDIMEQRGTGFERIRSAMLDHGLSAHKLDQHDGYFKVILPGPDGDFDRLLTPVDIKGFVPPSAESQLNHRQKQIMIRVQTEGSVNTAWVTNNMKVVKDTAGRDFALLLRLGLIERIGRGRGVRYIPSSGQSEPTDNRPMKRKK
ncbi:MAG: DUF4062 domain-containing protein [Gammaproteobacteria bacterium]|nr:DUF4062 domain-containing protein [Gammaproteobacteria bacterium]